MPDQVLALFDFNGKQVGHQNRTKGRSPQYQPFGVEIKKCLPYIGRITDSGLLFVCEGPTDCIEVAEIVGLEDWSVVGYWSASTIPDSEWHSRLQNRISTVVCCGDNDDAGQVFNQRVANEFGCAYPIKWPPLFRHKGDAKDYISEYGESAFVALARGALIRTPLYADNGNKNTTNETRTYQKHSGIISTIVDAAGGEFKYSYGTGNEKWLCPLHNDVEDPSLTLNNEDGSWKCWAGCGQGGPAQFIMAWKGVNYKSALELMKRYV